MSSRHPRFILASLVTGWIFAAVAYPADGPSSTPLTLVGVYPTGQSSPASATSTRMVFEYKSDPVYPYEEGPVHLQTDAVRLKNWTLRWGLETETGVKVSLPQAQLELNPRERYYLTCQLTYAGSLRRQDVHAVLIEDPGAADRENTGLTPRQQEYCRPEVLIVPAAGISITRNYPSPSFFARLFGAKKPVRTVDPAATPPNVVLFMIDTLRPDRTSPYGHPFILTPHMDMLASLGVRFTEAHGASPSTRPSVGSMFTGLQPKAHGAVRHATQEAALYLGVPLLPETFQRNGYITRGISSNSQVTAAFGFGRGFDAYECPVWETQVSLKAIDSLQSLDEPFFLYLHYMGPHQPYAPPAPWLGLYHGQTGFTREETLSDTDKAERQQKEEAYFEEITAEDRRIGQVLRELAWQGVLDRTVIWLVSDHGEEFWEHGWNGHGAHLFEETAKTVSILFYPARLPRGAQIPVPVTHADLFPTLAALLDWPPLEECQGRNLLPAIAGAAEPEWIQRPLFLHHGGGTGPGPHESDKSGVLCLDKKLIWWDQKNTWELYNLTTDPGEQSNIIETDPETAESLKSLLVQHLVDCARLAKKFQDLDSGPALAPVSPIDLENMKNYGYIGGGTAKRDESETPP
ncbi:MAG: sulfatase [bacterium]